MKLYFLLSVLALFFCFANVNAQKTESGLAITDQRQIIEVLLKEKFGGSTEKTIYISTINLPAEIQSVFPSVKDKNIQLISNETSAGSDVCAYEFGEFEFIDKFVSVSFGDCKEGLAYDFQKSGDTWKSVGLIVTKPIFY